MNGPSSHRLSLISLVRYKAQLAIAQLAEYDFSYAKIPDIESR